jgi:alpha-L-fucosidase
MRFLIIITGILLYSCSGLQDKKPVDKAVGAGSREQYIEWFKDAKFGMFIHWGPYSNLSGEWNGRQVPVGSNAEWIMKNLEIPVNEYRELAREMNPVKFNAREWAELARSTGMKYIVITSKHHDGFAMYHSQVSPYNIVDWTQYKRDPLKELADACSDAGIKFCVYYSHREDWDHPGGYGNDWDYDNDWGSDLFHQEKFEQYLEEKAKPQLKELLTGYGPIGLVWFDRGMYTPEQGLEFVNLVNSLQPATLINGRVGHYNQEFIGDYQSTNDNGMPPGGLEEYWETPQTLNQTWGYSKFDTTWKSPETVICRLAEVVSRGGNYLLNIGPKGNGEIPDTTIAIFREVGEWLKRNSESIYGTSANPFGELPWGYCTVKNNRLFLLIRDWPEDGKLYVKGLQNQVVKAYPLVDKSPDLTVNKEDNVTYVNLPDRAPDYPLSVVVLEVDGEVKVSPRFVTPDNGGRAELNYLTVTTDGEAKTRFNRKGGFHISKWRTSEDAANWHINFEKPGTYHLKIDYAANSDWEGQQYEVKLGDHSFRKTVVSAGGYFNYHEFPVGYVDIKDPGLYTLSVHPVQAGETYLMHLRSLSIHYVEKVKDQGWGIE